MNNKSLTIACLTCLALIMLSGTASATATTHIWGPSTDVQAYKLWHMTGDLYLPVERDASGGRLPAVTNLGLTVGVLPLKNLNAEVGFDHKSGMGAADDYPMYLNFKFGVPEGAFGSLSPAVALGAFDIGTKKDMTDYNVFYGKLAKSLSVSGRSLGRISAGYFIGNENLLFDGRAEKDNAGVLVAWERTVSEVSDKLWFCVEYMGTESVYGTLNVAAAWKVAPNVAVLAGYDVFNNEDLIDTGTLQVDIDF